MVGVGRQALEDHIPGLAASDCAQLVAICDENPEVVREQQDRQRVPGYTDFREMFQAEQLDLVVVTVPHHVGRAVIETAAGHRVHVLKEKPFATGMDEARALAGICEQSGIQLMVTLQRRSTRSTPASSSWPTRSAPRSSSMPGTPCTSPTRRRGGAARRLRRAAAASSTWATTSST